MAAQAPIKLGVRDFEAAMRGEGDAADCKYSLNGRLTVPQFGVSATRGSDTRRAVAADR
uniref:Uncharacterized protein n=1 Tax=Hyaloperonospora arabidopsidis (strain Emoy2) TaxID=559515 RepID=M4C1J6_HYAAE